VQQSESPHRSTASQELITSKQECLKITQAENVSR